MYNALVMLYGVISIRDQQTNFKRYRIGLLEFSPFLNMRFAHVLLDELLWERLEYVRLKQLAVTMYKIHNDLSPSFLRRIFTNTQASNAHSHNLRNSELYYYVPRPSPESAKGSLHYRGSVLWNKIPSEIKNLPSQFKCFQNFISWKRFRILFLV